MKQTVPIQSAWITGAAALAVAAVVWASRAEYVGRRAGHADENYLDSKTCIACHTDHYASWARTYHSRMTQDARPDSVQGDFERDNTFEYLGIKAKMERHDDKFTMAFDFPGGGRTVYPIDRTVGSRRIEQYVGMEDGKYVRLPLAYDLVNHRWMSLNGSFFYPDGNNYFQHQATWDANCVFCHNVKAQPHMEGQMKRFSTEVAELGIACGACHGMSAAHAEKAASPFTREGWRLTGTVDKRIVDPPKLSAEKSMMICGHCHGQRVPTPDDRIQEILHEGDPYNAGDDLAKFYKPVTRETKIGNFSFASRFWNNGSPRLTAYEYQGILRSQCFIKGHAENRINCLTCHSMHDADPKGQVKPVALVDEACLKCHPQFSEPAAMAAHSGHAADSSGSRCYDCHMPRVVYGIMTFHRTHDITIPDARLTVSQGVPNACNQCHLDKSANWAIRESKRIWPQRFGNAELSKDDAFDQPEGVRELFAGDALTRAMAANAMKNADPNWATPFLIEAFGDNYPIVRYFAAQGLAAAGQNLPKPDYLAAERARQASFEQWWSAFAKNRPDVESIADPLRKRRVNVDVEVGE